MNPISAGRILKEPHLSESHLNESEPRSDPTREHYYMLHNMFPNQRFTWSYEVRWSEIYQAVEYKALLTIGVTPMPPGDDWSISRKRAKSSAASFALLQITKSDPIELVCGDGRALCRSARSA
jgi:hypothetical protein